MYYELALISVLIAASYWGLYFVRLGPQTRTVRADAARRGGRCRARASITVASAAPAWFGVAGAIGVGAGACLLVLGPLVRATARRFAGAERFEIAERLLDVADVLAPGSGVAEEKALLAAMREIRDGNIEQTVDALTAARERAPAEARLAIDERIAMLYLAAYRWDEAIAHAEENLFGVELRAATRRSRRSPGSRCAARSASRRRCGSSCSARTATRATSIRRRACSRGSKRSVPAATTPRSGCTAAG